MITAKEARENMWNTDEYIGYLEWKIKKNMRTTNYIYSYLKPTTDYNKVYEHFTKLGYRVIRKKQGWFSDSTDNEIEIHW